MMAAAPCILMRRSPLINQGSEMKPFSRLPVPLSGMFLDFKLKSLGRLSIEFISRFIRAR